MTSKLEKNVDFTSGLYPVSNYESNRAKSSRVNSVSTLSNRRSRSLPSIDLNTLESGCLDLWNRYHVTTTSLSNEDSDVSILFNKFADRFLYVYDNRASKWSNTVGHPTILVEHIVQLLLEQINIQIQDNRSNSLRTVNGYQWLEEPGHEESILDEVTKATLDQQMFIEYTEDISRQMEDSKKREYFTKVLYMTAILVRWPHNQAIIVNRYGIRFARIIVLVMQSLCERVEDFVIIWSDIDPVGARPDLITKTTQFLLTSLLGIIQIYSLDGVTESRSEFDVFKLYQPFEGGVIKNYWSVDIFSIPKISENIEDREISDATLTDSILSTPISKPVSNTSTPQQISGEYSSMGFLEKLVGHNSVATLSSLLRKVGFLSSYVASMDNVMKEKDQALFDISEIWRLSIIIQCEVLASFLKVLRSSREVFVDQYFQCSGCYALQQLLSVKATNEKTDLKKEDNILLSLRSLLCVKVNLAVIDASQLSDMKSKGMMYMLLPAESFTSMTRFLMGLSEEETMIPRRSNDLDIEFSTTSFVFCLDESSSSAEDKAKYRNAAQIRYHHNFYASEAYRQRYFEMNDAKSKKSGKISTDIRSYKETFREDFLSDVIENYFNNLLQTCQKMMSDDGKLILELSKAKHAGIKDYLKNNFLFQVLHMIKENYIELQESNTAPVFQYHLTMFLGEIWQLYPSSSIYLFQETNIFSLLFLNSNFLSSGQRKMNNLMKYGRRRIRLHDSDSLTIEDSLYKVSIDALNYEDVSLTATTLRKYYALHYKYLHDTILDLIYSILNRLIDIADLEASKLLFTNIIENLAKLYMVSSCHDVIVQVSRLLTRILSNINRRHYRSKVWATVMFEVSNLCRNHVISIASSDFVGDDIMKNSETMPIFWSARVAVLHLMQTIVSTVDCSGWIKAFFIGIPQSPSIGAQNVSKHFELTSKVRTANIVVTEKVTESQKDVLMIPEKTYLLNQLDFGQSGVILHRHVALLRLVFYKKSSDAALLIIRKIFHQCALIAFGKLSEIDDTQSTSAMSNSSDDRESRSRSLSYSTSAEALAHDIIRVSLQIIRYSARQSESLDNSHCAKKVLDNFTTLISRALNITNQKTYWQIFESFGPMTNAHRDFSWRHSYGNIFVELWQSIDDCVTYNKCTWPKEIKTEILHAALRFTSALICGNNYGKDLFGQFIYSKKISNLSYLAIQSTPESNVSSKFDIFIKAVVSINSEPSVETLVILFEMIFDMAHDLHPLLESNDSENIEVEDLFEDGVPTIMNLNVVPLILYLVPYCSPSNQILIFHIFLGLLDSESATANLFKCTRMDPSMFELLLDIFPGVYPEVRPYLTKLLENIGSHVVTVAQLKRLFQLINSKVDDFSANLIDALRGMIGKGQGPRNFLYFDGVKSGLQLPAMQKWPASRGYTISLWFTVNMFQSSSRSSSFRASKTSQGANRKGKSMYLLSLRQASGVGLDIVLLLDTEASIKSKTKLIVLLKSYGIKENQNSEIEVPVSGHLLSSRSINRRSEAWHHLIISHAGPTMVKRSEIIVSMDGAISKHNLAYPKFSEAIEYPIIGDCNADLKNDNYHLNFKGKLGSIYFFAEPLSEDQMMGVFELGPSYGDLFNDREHSPSNAIPNLHEERLTRTLNGSLTSLIMLAYNPGVWKDRYLIDITPEKNPNKWKVLSKKGSSNTKKVGMWHEPNAVRLKGTYRCSSRDMKDSFDCLGGVKVLLPLIAKLDTPSDTDPRSSKICSQVLELFFDMLRESTVNMIFMHESGLSLLAYILEKISYRHLNNDSLSMLTYVCNKWQSVEQGNPTKVQWLTDIYRYILGNFSMWERCDNKTQAQLFDHLLSTAALYPRIISEAVPPQKLFDTLLFTYRIYPKSESSYPRKDSLLSPEVSRSFSGSILRSRSQSSMSDTHSLSSQQVNDIRNKIFQLIYTFLSLSMKMYDETLQYLLSYIHMETINRYKVEGLQFFLRLTADNKPALVDRFLAGPFGLNSISLLSCLHRHRSARVRAYSVICFCSIVHLIVSRGKFPAVNQVTMQDGTSMDPSNASAYESNPQLAQNESSSMKSTKSITGNRELKEGSSKNVQSKQDIDTFTSFGISLPMLSNHFLYLQSLLKAPLKIFDDMKTTEDYFDIIFQALQVTMHGLSCKSLVGDIEKIRNFDDEEEPQESDSVEESSKSSRKYLRGAGRDTETQNMVSMKICVASVFPALVELIRNDILSRRHRIKMLLELKTSLQTFENIEMILSIPRWQTSFLDLLATEQTALSTSESYLYDNGWNGKLENPQFTLLNFHHETDLTVVRECREMFDIVTYILSEMHIHAMKFCSPPTEISICRPSEVGPASKFSKLMPRELLEFYSKGRKLGAATLEETITLLRCYGEHSEFDVRQTGVDLLFKTVEGIKRMKDSLINNLLEPADVKEIKRRLFDINMWIVNYIVAEFINIPPIQQAKLTKKSSIKSKKIDPPFEDKFQLFKVSPNFSSNNFSSPISRPLRKDSSGENMEEWMMASQSSHRPVSDEVNFNEDLLSNISSESDYSRDDSHNDSTIDRYRDNDQTIYHDNVPQKKSSSSRGSSASDKSKGPTDSSEGSTSESRDVRLGEDDEYFLNKWKLVESLLDVVDVTESLSAFTSETIVDRLKFGRKVGILLGMQIINNVNGSMNNMLPETKNVSNRGSVAAPLGRIVNSVGWVIIRLLLNIYSQGYLCSDEIKESSPYVQAIIRLNIVLASLKERKKHIYDAEVPNVICCVAKSLYSAASQTPSSAWSIEGFRTIINHMPNFRHYFMNKIYGDATSSVKETSSSKDNTAEVKRSFRSLSTNSDTTSISNSQTLMDQLELLYKKKKSTTSVINCSVIALDAIKIALSLSIDTQLTWGKWDVSVSNIIDDANRIEKDFMISKTTKYGWHRGSHESMVSLVSSKNSQVQYMTQLNTNNNDHLTKLENKESIRHKEVYKVEESHRKRCANAWTSLLHSIANERGPWGAGIVAESDKFWIIDSHETNQRMKPTLTVNSNGSKHSSSSLSSSTADGLRNAITKTRTGSVESISLFKDSPSRRESNVSLLGDGTESMKSFDTIRQKSTDKSELWKELLKYQSRRANSEEVAMSTDPFDALTELSQEQSDLVDDESNLPTPINENIDTIVTPGKQLLFQSRCEFITPCTNSSSNRAIGILEVTKSKISFTRDNSLDIMSLNNTFSPKKQKPYRNSTGTNTIQTIGISESHWMGLNAIQLTQWNVHEICGIYQRFYQLRFVAIEIFFTSRTSIFINFDDKDTAYRLQYVIRTRLKPPQLGPWIGVKPCKIVQNTSVMTSKGVQNLTEAWRRRDISNFDYLMKLNTIAGRTFNDLGQYPVFPWVLADYSSEVLDLTNPQSYRDLKYPIGAQYESQRELVRGKYAELSLTLDTSRGHYSPDSTPPFHFGSHYSVAGFILWYLMRCEPFTSLHIQLQDGKFDKPDRLFDSIESTYKSCTTTSSDVKELIPEFFYLPECLLNINRFDLGTTQNGRRIDHVILPRWANGDPYEFIRLHAEALESDYVSRNLHHWIDLIFGYKQRPPYLSDGDIAAVDACNTFYHLVYCDAVDLEQLKKNDKVLYDQVICQISEYGQTPCQLFKKPHPERLPFNQVDVVWPIASVVRGINTVRKESDIPSKPRCILSFSLPIAISQFPIVFIGECCEMDRQMLTLDSCRFMGYHGWHSSPESAIPPFKFKVDTISAEMSKGNYGSSMIGRLTSYNNPNSSRERRIGVAFASPVGYQFNRIGVEEGLAAHLSNRWKPIKVSTYERNEKKDRDRKLSRSASNTNLLNGKNAMDSSAMIRSTSDDSAIPLNSDFTASFDAEMSPWPLDLAAEKDVDIERKVNRNRSNSDASLKAITSKSTQIDATDKSKESLSPNRPNRERSYTETIDLTSKAVQLNNATVFDAHISSNLFVLIPELKLFFSGGHWDHSMRVTSVETGRLIQTITLHSDVVTCLASACDYDQYFLASGSRDCTIMVWNGIQVGKEDPLGKPQILYGHDDTVNSVAINAQLNIVVSGSNDGTIIIHSLRDFTYIRSIVDIGRKYDSRGIIGPLGNIHQSADFDMEDNVLSSRIPITWVGVSKERYIITYSSTHQRLCTYSINGYPLASKYVQEQLHVCLLSEDGLVLITGGEGCVVVFRWVYSLELANDGSRKGFDAVVNGADKQSAQSKPFTCPIRSLYLSKYERHLLVGLESGELRVLAMDSEYLRQRLQSKLIEIGIL